MSVAMIKFQNEQAAKLKDLRYSGKMIEYDHLLTALRNILDGKDYLTILYKYDKLIEDDYKRHNSYKF